VKQSSIYVCEPQPIVFEGLLRILESAQDLQICGMSGSLAAMMRDSEAAAADVALVGQAPGMHSAVALALTTCGTHLHGRVVIWVNEINETDAYRALQAGVRGVLFRTSPVERILECLRSTANGNVWLEPALNAVRVSGNQGVLRALTPRQREIADLVIRGNANAQIAAQLGISIGTLKVHLTHIYGKLGIQNRVQLALQGRDLLGNVELAEDSAAK
jgi:DNA-binding NarL/FixJ family response regulator